MGRTRGGSQSSQHDDEQARSRQAVELVAFARKSKIVGREYIEGDQARRNRGREVAQRGVATAAAKRGNSQFAIRKRR